MPDERIAATKALMARLRELKTSTRREVRDAIGDLPIVVALEDESAEDLVRRLVRYNPPVWLAVYYPRKRRLVLAEAHVAATERKDAVLINRETTVGMIVDAQRALAMPDSWATIELTQLVGT